VADAAAPRPAAAPPAPTPESLHDWALAIAEWSETLAKEANACSAQARRMCERLLPEKYDQGHGDTRPYGVAGRTR
jgi:hypothetical protein